MLMICNLRAHILRCIDQVQKIGKAFLISNRKVAIWFEWVQVNNHLRDHMSIRCLILNQVRTRWKNLVISQAVPKGWRDLKKIMVLKIAMNFSEWLILVMMSRKEIHPLLFMLVTMQVLRLMILLSARDCHKQRLFKVLKIQESQQVY